MQSDESILIVEEAGTCSPWGDDFGSKGLVRTDECIFKKCCKKYKKKGKKHCKSCPKR